MRTRSQRIGAVSLTILLSCTAAANVLAQTATPSFRVTSVERAESLGNPGPGGLIADSGTVVLVLTLAGVDTSAWRS
jgi:hypothetical protein